MEIVEFLVRARYLAALGDKTPRLFPLPRADALENVVVEGRNRAEFRARAHQCIAEQRIEPDRRAARIQHHKIDFESRVIALGASFVCSVE